ncbi:MAG: hypothetical protein KME31_28865 [Tolypothrix carrinoi HA7290-LM1]|jgi:hypothetical protein|nr:hypothetical protein [Tolypothrix carrinoi HA7290-LM1]
MGHWALVIGQWAMGNGQWAMGNGHARIKEAAFRDARCNTILSMPHAPCPIPHSPVWRLNNSYANGRI